MATTVCRPVGIRLAALASTLGVVGTASLLVTAGGCAAKPAAEPRLSIPQPTPREKTDEGAESGRTGSTSVRTSAPEPITRTGPSAAAKEPASPAPRLAVDAVRVSEPAIADEFNNIFVLGDLYLAGWPTEAGLKAMASRGVRRVISLKTAEEVEYARHYDPRAVAAQLGIEWIELPVHPDTYGAAEVAAFVATLDTSAGPLLVHCGSASTSAMVWSGYLACKTDMTVAEIMTAARAAGLLEGPMAEAAERVVRQIQMLRKQRGEAAEGPSHGKEASPHLHEGGKHASLVREHHGLAGDERQRDEP